MIICFELHFQSQWGQQCFITGDWPGRDQGDSQTILPMTYQDENVWIAEIECLEETTFRYGYLLQLSAHDILIPEENAHRQVYVPAMVYQVYRLDTWNAPWDNFQTFMKAPFQRAFLIGGKPEAVDFPDASEFSHEFAVKAPRLSPDEAVCLLGDIPGLGSWDLHQALDMIPMGLEWKIRLTLPWSSDEIHYKYAIYRPGEKQLAVLEEEEARILKNKNSRPSRIFITDNFSSCRTIMAWCGCCRPNIQPAQ